ERGLVAGKIGAREVLKSQGVAILFAPELSRLPQSALDSRQLGCAMLCRQFIAQFRAGSSGPGRRSIGGGRASGGTVHERISLFFSPPTLRRGAERRGSSIIGYRRNPSRRSSPPAPLPATSAPRLRLAPPFPCPRLRRGRDRRFASGTQSRCRRRPRCP